MATTVRAAGRRMAVTMLAALAALFVVAVSAAAPPAMTVEPVAPGVYAVIHHEPMGLANHGNGAFIVNEHDVVVVDSPFTRQATHEVIDALRRITDKPVSFVINTHWHDDHTFGNQVWREEYPGVTFVSTDDTRTDMSSVAVENRKSQIEGGPGAVASIKAGIEKGLNLEGAPLTDDERAALTSSIAIFEQYLAEAPDFRLTPADLTFGDRLTLIRGSRVIEVLHPGAGVTAGDAVVWLPADSVLFAGDLVNVPFPYTYRCQLNDWIGTLDRLMAMRPRLVVPGHGPVQTGSASIERTRTLLSTVRRRVAEAASQGAPIEEVRKNVRLDDLETAAAGDNRMLQFLFRNYFAGAAVWTAFQELTAGKH